MKIDDMFELLLGLFFTLAGIAFTAALLMFSQNHNSYLVQDQQLKSNIYNSELISDVTTISKAEAYMDILESQVPIKIVNADGSSVRLEPFYNPSASQIRSIQSYLGSAKYDRTYEYDSGGALTYLILTAR